MGKFTLFTGRNGQFYWNLKAANGETLCHSEGYTTKQNAKNGIEACKIYSQGANFTFLIGKDSQHYWNLKASNGQIVCQSEGYVSKQGAENGARSCRENAPNAPIVDLS
ncbi:MAG: hypothetical protein CMH30_05025 [Micavibrio sp.]|nr:hypothetical protein [Micavibrio sp.]|tara:strand:- start:141 stop:467 length:327 start_codon:yes stop_codon:yes gene_type:complete